MEDACEAINQDWSVHAKDIRAASSAAVPDTKLVPTSSSTVAASGPPVIGNQPTQLQVSSTPDGADIEIDGNYVGNTPSTVGTVAGQHEISLKKSGFKPWERKISVTSGQVKVNATLEPEK